jgi:hypothetical protein
MALPSLVRTILSPTYAVSGLAFVQALSCSVVVAHIDKLVGEGADDRVPSTSGFTKASLEGGREVM